MAACFGDKAVSGGLALELPPTGVLHVKLLQSCLTLYDPMDHSLPGFFIHWILQARILKWVVISFSRDHSDPGIKPGSPSLQADSLPFEPLLLLSHFSRVRLCTTHRRQPTRLPRPWDSPGKNTGVGCHFLLRCMKVKSESEVAQSCLTLSLPDSSVHGIFQARVLEWGATAFSEDKTT